MSRVDPGAPDVLAWTRSAGSERLLVLVSFVGEERSVRLPDVVTAGAGGDREQAQATKVTGWQPVVGSHRDLPASVAGGDRLRLRPDEALILAASDA